MIKINLLPQEMAGGRAAAARGGGGSGSAVVALVLAAIFIVDIGIGAMLFLNYNQAKNRYDDAKASADKARSAMNEVKGDYDNARLSFDRMSKLLAVAEALDPPDRLLWSRKLNALPMLVPDGVYTTTLQVTQKVSERETPASIKRRNEYEKAKKGTPPPIEKTPVFAQSFIIGGIAYVAEGSENQRLDYVVQFKRNLTDKKVKLPFDKTESSFLDGFNPNIIPSAVQNAKSDGRDVTTFRFTINAKPVSIEEKDSEDTAPAPRAAATPSARTPTPTQGGAKNGTD